MKKVNEKIKTSKKTTAILLMEHSNGAGSYSVKWNNITVKNTAAGIDKDDFTEHMTEQMNDRFGAKLKRIDIHSN